jgi:hypothetical protein
MGADTLRGTCHAAEGTSGAPVGMRPSPRPRDDALPGATWPWALARSVDALLLSLAPLTNDTPFVHPEWGDGTVADALRWLAHETVHHELDVRRGLDQR